MAITPLPTPPTRSDPNNFAVRGDAFMTSLPQFVTETNAMITDYESKYTIVVSKSNEATTAASTATSASSTAVSAKNQIEILWLGAKASNPSVNNQGGALVVGSKYFNTTASEERVWNGTSWLNPSIIGGTVTSLNATTVATTDLTVVNGYVQSLSIANSLSLPSDSWITDEQSNQRLYLYGSSGANLYQGNSHYFRLSNGDNATYVNNDGSLYQLRRATVGSSTLTTYASLTIGADGNPGGTNSIHYGITAGAKGGFGVTGGDGNGFYAASNTYYNGGDKAAVAGYGPSIRLNSSDGGIRLYGTQNAAADETYAYRELLFVSRDGAVTTCSTNISNQQIGYLGFIPGGTGNAGYIATHLPNGTRVGYIGNSPTGAGTANEIMSEGGHPWQFNGMAPRSSVDATTGNDLPRLSQFAASKSATGYQILPTGLIIQWGTTSASNAGTTVTLPIAFPTLKAIVNCSCVNTANIVWVGSDTTLSSITVYSNAGVAQSIKWIAIGY